MKPDPQAQIRAAFRERRKRLGISQAGMADLLGIHKLTYSRMETVSRLTPEIRAQLDKVLSELEAEMKRQTT